jgi:ATP/maltotriose-dependent transcriptional regulator MalT
MAERGDVCVRGDWAGAQAAYERAIGFGHEPEPGLALLWLAEGRTEAAVAAVRRLLGEAGDQVRRAQLLPARVEVLAAAGQHDQAAACTAELESIAGSFGCPSVHARADYAAALVAVESGDAAAVMPLVRRACAIWERLGARYETAGFRVVLGRALRALGDDESAITELAAAQLASPNSAQRRPSARPLHGSPPTYPNGLTAREVDVLRLVAAGRTNPEIAALVFISEKTVARHLSNIFTKLDVTSRTATPSFAFDHRIT